MFKNKNNIASEIMKELFTPKISHYDLRLRVGEQILFGMALNPCPI